MHRRLLSNPIAPATALVMIAGVVSGCLTYEGFLRKKADTYCETLAKCNPDTPCAYPSPADTGYGDFDDCDFDSAAARDCLRGEWICSNDFGGQEFSYPLSPEICDSVCRSAK